MNFAGRVLESVEGHFAEDSLRQINVAFFCQFNQIDQHVAELLGQVLPLRLGPVRQTLLHLPAPLEELRHLSDLPDHRKQQVPRLVELVPVPLLREFSLHAADVFKRGLGGESESLGPVMLDFSVPVRSWVMAGSVTVVFGSDPVLLQRHCN